MRQLRQTDTIEYKGFLVQSLRKRTFKLFNGTTGRQAHLKSFATRASAKLFVDSYLRHTVVF